MKNQKRSIVILITLIAFLASLGIIQAGQLTPTAPPAPTMKTLNEIPPAWSQKIPAVADRFTIVLDGAGVLDKETGLVWERIPDTTLRTWNDAVTYCYSKTVGDRKGWRLPTIEELASLLDPTQGTQNNPALPNGHPFQNVQRSGYWSTTTRSSSANEAWGLYFYPGGVGTSDKAINFCSWCLRGGHGHDAY
jgi:hypothetical protein